MAAVPNWAAARSGVLGDTGAVNHASQIDQFLGAHGITLVYQGAAVVAPTGGSGFGSQDPANYWISLCTAFDFDQPFTMSGTVIGRVEIPILPVGAGADLVVSLCPDSSGNPGTPITSVRIPASWITAFAQVAGATGPDSALQLVNTGAPLALPQFNAAMMAGGFSGPWANPASSGMGAASNPISTYSGNYFIQLGGFASGTAPPQVANVFTINWQGGSALASAIPQPSLPTATSSGAAAATATTLVYAGGQTGSPATSTAVAYTAGWSPATGQVSGWSQQASLPQALNGAFATTSGNNVYVVGGVNGSGTVLNTVYWATVSNGQLQTWNSTIMPMAVASPHVAAIGGYLVVAGGYTTVGTVTTSSVYYAAINADGSLGSWQRGPSMPTAVANVGNDLVVTDSGLVIIGGYTGAGYTTAIQSLAFGASGPGEWQTLGSGSTSDSAVFQAGAGQWRVFSINPSATTYGYADVYTTPRISVPMPVTGLTNGATYHIQMQQYGGDLNNYLRGPVEGGAPIPGGLTYRKRAKGSSTWAAGGTGFTVPVSIFDQTAGGQPWHMYEDGGARISTLAWRTTPDATLLGVAEAVMQPAPVLNSNYTFTSGLTPWTATGGTAIQSAAHTQGNLPFSAQVTPSGVASTSYIESEKVAIQQGHSYAATAWLYSGPGYSSSAVNINWYNSGGTLVSTTSGTVTALAAGVWKQLTTTGSAPANAATATIVAAESGTPSSSAVFYVSAATLQDVIGPMLSSVTQINYPSATPGKVPTSITQLA